MGHNDGIDHPSIDRLLIPSRKQTLLVDFLCNLVYLHSVVRGCQDKDYGFFDFHVQIYSFSQNWPPRLNWKTVNDSVREWIGDSGSFTSAAPSPYIAPPPSRHDTQQIPVVRSLGLCRRSNNLALAPLSWHGGALLPCSGSNRLSYRR